MDHPLRYVFHSHAAAFGGRIVRPKDIVLEAHGASALLVTGGRSVAQLQRTTFDEFFEVESANTLTEGFFEDFKGFVDVTNHKAEEQSLAALSRARAEVNGLAIGRKPRLTIGRIRAELTNRSPGHSGQPSIRIGKDTVIDGISIDGHRLVVELYTKPFVKHDTHAKLLAAADDSRFVEDAGESLFMSKRFAHDSKTPAFRKLIRTGNTIYATIVKSIRWDGKPFPKSEIHDNVVVLPDFGRVFFGELLISEQSRRLTMVRMALGSDAGGSASAGDVETNGILVALGAARFVMRTCSTFLLLLLVLPGCARSARDLQQRYDRARQAMWRGDLTQAQQLADADAGPLMADPASPWLWRFRLLSCEIAILRRDFGSAESVIKTRLPNTPVFDDLRSRQRFLEAKLEAERGQFRNAHLLLAKARPLIGGDVDLRLDVDRLDGQALARLGEWAEGDRLLDGVVTTAGGRSDRYHQAVALNDLGMSHVVRSRYDEALGYFERVLAMRDLSDWSIYAASLTNAGSCYQRLGQFDRAISLQQRALEVHEHRGKREDLVRALGEMGNLYVLRGEPGRALPYLKRGLDEGRVRNLTPEIARLAGNLATATIDLERWDEAERYNQEAQRLWLDTHPLPSVYHLLNSALIAKGRGQLDEAARLLTQVIASQGSPPSVLWDAHFDLAEVELARKQPDRAAAEFEAALTIIETTRAGLLRTDDKVSFLTRLISFYQTYVSALIARGQTDRALEVADSSRGQLLAERQRTSAPARARAADFLRVARESNTVMLSYWLDPDRSWLWVISPRGVQLLPLPPAKEIEGLVRRHQAAIADSLADLLGASHTPGDTLFQMLVAPAAQWIPQDARVIIVPDGVLHEINFETLTLDAPPRHFWIDDVQVEIAPSLATLTAAAAPVASGQSRLLLVGNARAHEPDFPALTHAAAEMSNVAARFGPDLVTTLDGDRASPAAYSEARPDRFAYVHFAAHATANLDSPLDSVVVLSGPEDRFKLYARDVAVLRLHAELVTISACRSAGDRAYAGDGLVGFSWAFLKAGARHVIAGLWDLDDGSTPQLMDRLYAGIALGHSPGRALRDAKRAALADGGSSAAPYRWAALQLFTASL